MVSFKIFFDNDYNYILVCLMCFFSWVRVDNERVRVRRNPPHTALHPQLKDPLVNEFYDELFKHWRLKDNAPPVIDLLDDEEDDDSAGSAMCMKSEDDGDEIDLGVYFEAVAVNDPYGLDEVEAVREDAHENSDTPPDDLDGHAPLKDAETTACKPSPSTGVGGHQSTESSPATNKPSFTPEPITKEDLMKRIQLLQLLDMVHQNHKV